ncbi:GAF domain-containing protein [Streptomyces sp. AP-93]|uniref:GAF domain-containing protein n=1 Tax=Streptomyces sp. AP-93 TaxID=2929048 RepID=UPI001FB01273|nr:GAF domain-containing protein [Streptomyces sp. AP-93]MCJ0869758.1 GAF domain-containing protein [Streptomyces sp. AP-93]
MTSDQQLAEAFVDLSDTLADDVEPLTLLDRLVRHCVALTRVDAAGVMLANARNQLRPAAATDDRVALTELMQTQAGQGPCVDAFTFGAPVHADRLSDHEERWPAFLRVARSSGYESAHALPLRAREHTVGALNLLCRVPTTLTADEIRLLRALADVATSALLTWVREPLGVADIVTRTQAALSSKAVVDTACGMLAATASLAPHAAELHLRAYAARRRLRATDVAARLVRREILPGDVLAEALDGK